MGSRREKIVGRTVAAVSFLGYVSAACVATPPHDGLARVHVDDVVKRVKCDIAHAVLLKTNQRSRDGKHHPFGFLTGWAAKLHLTIAVDDTASINPGATIIRALPSVGSTAQSYSTGIGVGVSTEAVRTEDIEFLMSFSDLKNEFSERKKGELYNFCQFDRGLLLESDLGLDALVDAALQPVASGVLQPGNNIGPGATPPDTPAKQLEDSAGQLSAIENQQKKFRAFAELSVETNIAREIEKRAQAIINNIVKPIYGIASATTSPFDPICIQELSKQQNEAIVLSVGVSQNVIEYDQKPNEATLNKEKQNFSKLVDATNVFLAAYQKCANAVTIRKPKVYDPIDVIQETVNFYITSSGSVTPTWKLVNVTAPLASTFASASRKDTNTLILTMGRPVLAPDGSVSASAAMNNQILAALLAQALMQRPAP